MIVTVVVRVALGGERGVFTRPNWDGAGDIRTIGGIVITDSELRTGISRAWTPADLARLVELDRVRAEPTEDGERLVTPAGQLIGTITRATERNGWRWTAGALTGTCLTRLEAIHLTLLAFDATTEARAIHERRGLPADLAGAERAAYRRGLTARQTLRTARSASPAYLRGYLAAEALAQIQRAQRAARQARRRVGGAERAVGC